ncbi:hypothetical protein SAMN04487962_101361 [Marinobacter segnicrescens]|uniref:Uncharacterized protein n=1 Tax=Marinobacter segnicrescens TaxID=430453 RepID=A0A1H9YVG1_9GAMM|nr:hypothetical protein SAMN04487962_101361 [Marinobacter segnicrescens]
MDGATEPYKDVLARRFRTDLSGPAPLAQVPQTVFKKQVYMGGKAQPLPASLRYSNQPVNVLPGDPGR